MTKNEMNVNDKRRVGRQAIAYLLISATAGLLVLGGKSYIDTTQQIATDEREIELMCRLSNLDRTDYLLRQFGSGESHAARQVLAMQLRSELSLAKQLLPSVDVEIRELGQRLCDRVAQAQRKHPEYYLVSSKSTSSAVLTPSEHGVDLPAAAGEQNN